MAGPMPLHEKYIMLVSIGGNYSSNRGCWTCGKAPHYLMGDPGQVNRSLTCGGPCNVVLRPMNFNLAHNQPQLLAANLRPLSAGL
jgi:hypothetical protein